MILALVADDKVDDPMMRHQADVLSAAELGGACGRAGASARDVDGRMNAAAFLDERVAAACAVVGVVGRGHEICRGAGNSARVSRGARGGQRDPGEGAWVVIDRHDAGWVGSEILVLVNGDFKEGRGWWWCRLSVLVGIIN